MSSTRQQRPGDQEKQAPQVQAPQPLQQKKPDAVAQQPASADVQGGELSPETAASMQGTWGNAMVQDLATGSRDANELGEQQEEEAGQEQETERERSGRGNAATAGAQGFAGGGASPVMEAPWSAGVWFGGDDDATPGPPRIVQRWRAPVVPEDPDDEEPPLGGGAGDDEEEVPPLDDAVAALEATDLDHGAGFLARGLRHPRRLAVRQFSPAVLARQGPQEAWVRARAALAFLARHGDGRSAVVAALGSAAGPVCAPVVGGLSGATARALAWLELALDLTQDRAAWEQVLWVATDVAARPRVELAAAMFDEGALEASALFESVVAPGIEGPPATSDTHPAAEAALLRAANLGVLPSMVYPQPLAPGAPHRAPFADVFRALTGGQDAPDFGWNAVYDAWNRALAALGEVQVEVAAAAVSVRDRLPRETIRTILGDVSAGLVAVARVAVRAGEAAEPAPDLAAHHRASLAFAQALDAADDLRRDALRRLGQGLPLPPEPLPELDEPVLAALASLAASEPALVRAAMEPLAATDHYAAPLAASALAGEALGREDWFAAMDAGLGMLARPCGPYGRVDAALVTAAALRGQGADWRPGLRRLARELREAGEGGAVNLLVAGWAEAGQDG